MNKATNNQSNRASATAMAMGLALTMGTGCIFTTDDSDGDGNELTVSWSFKNIDAPASCPQGDFNVVVYTLPVGAAESATEGVAYNCSAGSGYSAPVSGQVDVWIELIDSANSQLYARSKTERIDANSVSSVAFAAQLDYGFYQLNWGYFATTGEGMEQMTCANAENFVQTTGDTLASTAVSATYTDSNEALSEWPAEHYDCVVGEAPAVFYTEPMPFAVSNLKVQGANPNDEAVGIGGCIKDEDGTVLPFQYGNEIVDAGLLLVSLDVEDQNGEQYCYEN